METEKAAVMANQKMAEETMESRSRALSVSFSRDMGEFEKIC